MSQPALRSFASRDVQRRLTSLIVACGAFITAQSANLNAQAASPAGLSRVTQGGETARTLAILPYAQRSASASWWSPLASLVVPGSGQMLMNQQRGFGYLVLEGYLLVQAASAQRSGNEDRAAYRRVASEVARAQFGSVRPEGVWTYYEALESYLESGNFDAVPGGTLQPESNPATFNGAQWLLARETFWVDPESPPPEESPEYQRALDFYRQRAVSDNFRWSWRDAQLQQDVYRQHITSANRNYQRAVNLVSAVAANHLLSMVDAYISVRLRRIRAGESQGQGGPEFNSSIELWETPQGSHLRHRVSLRLPLPNEKR